VRFIAEHADRATVDGLRWGVEPICAVLAEQGTPIAPSTYYEHRNRRPSRAEQRDGRVEGFGDVVVGAGVEGVDFLAAVHAAGQDEDRHGGPGAQRSSSIKRCTGDDLTGPLPVSGAQTVPVAEARAPGSPKQHAPVPHLLPTPPRSLHHDRHFPADVAQRTTGRSEMFRAIVIGPDKPTATGDPGQTPLHRSAGVEPQGGVDHNACPRSHACTSLSSTRAGHGRGRLGRSQDQDEDARGDVEPRQALSRVAASPIGAVSPPAGGACQGEGDDPAERARCRGDPRRGIV